MTPQKEHGRKSFFQSFADAFRREMQSINGKWNDETLRPNEAQAVEILHEIDIATLVQMVNIADVQVDFRLYANRIARMVKKPGLNARGKQGYERIYLADFTPAMATESGLLFTIADCIVFTKNELNGAGVQSRPGQPEIKAMAVKTTPMPTKHPSTTSQDQPETPKARESTQAEGKVIFAGENMIYPKGRRPYWTFSVTLQTSKGEVVFSGVELEKKFRAGEFACGDRISIGKSTYEFVMEMNGARQVRTKNQYRVTMLKTAR